MSKFFDPVNGYFGTLLAALLGNATRRVEGQQNSGGGGGFGAGQHITADAALKLSAVWACVRLISEAVGAMPIKVWTVNDDGTKTENKDHWIYSLLNFSPNRYQTRNEFFETFTASLMLHGNAYVRHVKKTRSEEIISLMPMMPAQTEVTLTALGDRIYKFTDGKDVAVFAQDRVWHVPLMPTNTIVGLSPLQYGARSMGIAIASENRVQTLAANGFKPTGVLMIDKILKPEQREQIRNEFKNLQEGQGDPLKVLEAGLTYQQVSITPKDAQLLESRKFNVEDIGRIYGVPSVLINDTSASTVWGTGIGEIKEGFYTLTLQPLLEKIESSIVKWLIPPQERRKIEIEFEFSKFLRGNDQARTERLKTAISGNILTINEARATEGLAPVPNGDVMYAQSQMIPIGSQASPDGIVDRRKPKKETDETQVDQPED